MLCHINVIPLNPTKGYDGKPTNKIGVDKFIKILGDEYGKNKIYIYLYFLCLSDFLVYFSIIKTYIFIII